MPTDGADRKWAVLLEDREEPVGFTALYGIGGQLAPELGCVIADPAAWGKGVGREAERLTLSQGFRRARRAPRLRPDPGDEPGGEEGRHLARAGSTRARCATTSAAPTGR